MKMKYRFISWKEYGKLIEELMLKLERSKEKFNGVYGIPNGAYPIALTIHHRFNIPMFKKLKPGCLVCDDLSDSGKTLSKKLFTKHRIACLFSTPWTKVKPDWFVRMKMRKNEWLIFPYENLKSENGPKI